MQIYVSKKNYDRIKTFEKEHNISFNDIFSITKEFITTFDRSVKI